MVLIGSAYAASVVVWNILRLTPLATWAPFEFADLFGWALYVPFVFIAAGALLSRRRAAIAVLLIPAVLFGVEYGPQFLPHRLPVGEPLRFLTMNLYSRNPNMREVQATIAAADADIVALQELSPSMSRWLADGLRGRFPHQALYPGGSASGFGVLSRFPIVERRRPDLRAGACRCHLTRLRIGSAVVSVINAHPIRPIVGLRGFNTEHQVPTVDAIVRELEVASGPVVLLGDLNIADRHFLYRRLRSYLGDAHRDAGWGLGLTWSFRRRVPLVRIDYVLHDEAWGARGAWTGRIPGSDHRYVGAELVLTRPNGEEKS